MSSIFIYALATPWLKGVRMLCEQHNLGVAVRNWCWFCSIAVSVCIDDCPLLLLYS